MLQATASRTGPCSALQQRRAAAARVHPPAPHHHLGLPPPSLGSSTSAGPSIPLRRVSARATILPGSSQGTQRFVSGQMDVEVPLAAVQKLDEPVQGAVVAGIFAALTAGAYGLAQGDLEWTSSPVAPYLFGIIFSAAGIAHFTSHDEFCTMMPTKGAWGFWNLPGSDSFHVNWTGVAEVAGGVGLLASTFPQLAEAAPWLRPAAALGLLALCVAVTPSNIFMFTHNAPGPGPKGAVIPTAGHLFRGVMQSVLWVALWGMYVNSQ